MVVDASDLQLGRDRGDEFTGGDVDEMALEVERACIAADSDASLVRRSFVHPDVLRLKRGCLSPEASDLVRP